MASDEDYEIPESGAVFTFGRSGFADNQPSHFFIRNDPVVEVSCGDEHTAIVCKNGRVFLFGHNDYGQLGLGHTRTVAKPSCLKYLKPFHATHVACGKGHTIVSSDCGRLFAFGTNSDGQLGTGDNVDRVIPQLVGTEHFAVRRIAALSAGCFHSACLTENGDVYTWGSNSDGQCGVVDGDRNLLVPTKIDFDSPVERVSCGYYHTAILSDGDLYTFGEEDNGKLGRRKSNETGNKPVKVETDFKCVEIECGGNHTLALSDEKKAFAFGSNFSGQLGAYGTNVSDSYSPVPVAFPDDVKITFISAGESHSAFITEDGELYMCGDARYGKICYEGDDLSNCPTPILITLFTNFYCAFVSCGGCQTMVIARAKTESESDNAKPTSLPPLKVKKSLPDGAEEILRDTSTAERPENDEKETMQNNNNNNKDEYDDRDGGGVKDDADEVADEERDYEAVEESRTEPEFENVYVEVKEVEPEVELIETDIGDHDEPPPSITTTMAPPCNDVNDPMKNSSDVVVTSEGRIKRLLNVFRRKRSATAVVISDTEKVREISGVEDGDADKLANGKKGNQQRSRACSIL